MYRYFFSISLFTSWWIFHINRLSTCTCITSLTAILMEKCMPFTCAQFIVSLTVANDDTLYIYDTLYGWFLGTAFKKKSVEARLSCESFKANTFRRITLLLTHTASYQDSRCMPEIAQLVLCVFDHVSLSLLFYHVCLKNIQNYYPEVCVSEKLDIGGHFTFLLQYMKLTLRCTCQEVDGREF